MIVEYALPLCLRAQIAHPGDTAAAMASVRGNTFARAGVEQAYWVLEAVRSGRPLADLFGGRRDRIAVGESLGIKASIDDLLGETGSLGSHIATLARWT